VSTATTVANRVVDATLQEHFAALSGDRNPMHMDAVAARRTQAGQPVVHGIHSLLWALDALAAKGLCALPVTRIRGRFLKWVYVGDEAELVVMGEGSNPTSLEVRVLGLPVLAADLTYGALEPWSGVGEGSPAKPLAVAIDRTIEETDGKSGEAYVAAASAAAEAFPALARMVGGTAIAEIASCSYIVGMEAPGLHSMFSKVDLRIAAPVASEGTRALHWDVTYTDARFRKAKIAVAGSAVTGTLDVFFRVPPVQQVGMALLQQHVVAGEFAGMRALIVGGSRGLGELTAKLIAAGGGVPTITYAVGKTDAEAVQAQIAAGGVEAKLLQYDVRRDAAEQIAGLAEMPTHLFYFATSTIYRPKQGVLSGPMLAEFVQFYVQGFYDLCVALTAASEHKLVVLYPSTVFVKERPAGMTEYAMIKAAGEQLCTDMNTYLERIHVVSHRFPKLPTDQTAGVIPERETDAMDAMLPVLRTMMGHSQKA
jgi:hypothetical protein